MKRLFLFALFCLTQEQSTAQQPGDTTWMRLNPSGDTIRSVKVQMDGKIVAAGSSYGAIAVGRFDNVGVPDPSFGTNGIVITSIDSAYTKANAVEIQPDGKIVVAGSYLKRTVGDFILARYKIDGSLDSSFGVNGIVQTDIDAGSFDGATSLVIQPSGKLVAAGWSGLSLAMCRYNTDGSLDSSFDSDGKLIKYMTGATCMKLQANGKMVVGCSTVVTRLNPDGSSDTTFGMNAVVSLTNACKNMAIQNDGKILFVGGDYEFILERLDTVGGHDNSFGNAGVVRTTGFYTGSHPSQSATSVCVQADGRILASGQLSGGLSNYSSFAVARYKTNGTLDNSFGYMGRVGIFNLFPNNFRAASYTSVINHNNELVVAGVNFGGGAWSEWALVGYNLGAPLNVSTISESDESVSVYPNPSSGIIIFSAPATIQRIEITDLTGKVVYRAAPAQMKTEIDLSSKAAGIYFYEVDCGSGKQRGKLVKE